MNFKRGLGFVLVGAILGAVFNTCPMEAKACGIQTTPPCHPTSDSQPAKGRCCGGMHLSEAIAIPTLDAPEVHLSFVMFALPNVLSGPTPINRFIGVPRSLDQPVGKPPPPTQFSSRAPPSC